MKKISISKIAYYTFSVSGMTSMVLNAMMPYIISRYGIEYTAAGRLLSILSVGNMLATFLAGWISNILGKKIVGLLGAVMAFLGMVTVAITGQYYSLAFAFLLVGISRGTISNVNNSYVNGAYLGEKKKLNYLHMCFSVGAFIAPLLTSFLLKLDNYWIIIFTIFSIFNAGSIGVYACLPKAEKKLEKDSFKKHNVCYKKLFFWVGALVLFFYIGIENSINGWLVTYLTDMNLLSVNKAQLLLSLLYFVMVIGRFTGAKIGSSDSGINLIAVFSVGAFLLYAIILFASNGFILMLAIAAIGFLFAPMYPTIISTLGHLLKDDGFAMGTLLTIGGFGKIVLPYIIGIVSDKYNLKTGMMTILFAFILMLLSILILKILGGQKNVNSK